MLLYVIQIDVACGVDGDKFTHHRVLKRNSAVDCERQGSCEATGTVRVLEVLGACVDAALELHLQGCLSFALQPGRLGVWDAGVVFDAIISHVKLVTCSRRGANEAARNKRTRRQYHAIAAMGRAAFSRRPWAHFAPLDT